VRTVFVIVLSVWHLNFSLVLERLSF
jgi:hypothetical protein